MDSETQRSALDDIRRSLSGSPSILLLVEDSEPDAQWALHVLLKFGVEARWVDNKAAALQFFRENDVRLVFLDLKLQSGYSGTELISSFKSIRPECWIVILSGAYAEDSKECKEALCLGAHVVMIKPLTAEKVKIIFGSP